MIFNLAKRFASRTVQRAHARVTAENERYVREAITRDAENELLTQELHRAKARIEELVVVVDELRRKQMHSMEITAERIEELDLLRVQVKALTDQLVELDELHADASARLEQAEEQLAQSQRGGVSLAQTAKAYRQTADADVARLQRRWDGHVAVCPAAQQLDDVDRDKRLENSE